MFNGDITALNNYVGGGSGAPVITQQPSNQTVTGGQTASFTALASGTPTPVVQWQVSTNGGASFADISGATSTTYSFSTTASQSGNQYKAVFTNSAGTATTNAATLTVTTVSGPAVLTTPVPGSTLLGVAVTFGWSSGSGVSEYFLYVGTTADGNDLYGQSQGTNLSATVSGLPTNGQTLYVTLWSLIAGVWQTNTYTYTAASANPTCTYTLGTSSASFSASASASSGSVNVTTTSACAWTAASNASWISVTSGASTTGSGSVGYSVAANTASTSRTGTLTIAGQTFTVTQAGTIISTFALLVSANGTGAGTVSSSPAGIDCGSACTSNFTSGTSVTLTATPATGSNFAGWSGSGCSGTGSCTVAMNSAQTVTATFTLIPVAPPGCTLTANPASISAGSSSTLTASCSPAATSYTWTGGSCAGMTGASCTVTPAATTTYTVSGSNSGGTGTPASATVTVTTVPGGIPASERAVLINLYNSTNGASWTKNTGWMDAAGTECTWYGITCDGSKNHVTQISLRTNNLVGTLPSLSGLTALYAVSIGNNQLTGSIPSLSGLSALSFFTADSNQLTGSIPSLSGLTSLVFFGADDNQLTGSIPPLSGLTSLQGFSASSNQLTGSIPSLNGLTALLYFYSSSNQLTGPIPGLSGLTGLHWFDVGYNQLTGSIPTLTGLIALQAFTASNNQLTGSIPSLSGLTALQGFKVSSNQLAGSVPAAPTSLLVGGSSLCGNNLVSSGNAAIDAAWVTANGGNWLACQTVIVSPVCTLTALPTSISAGGSSTLTANCSPAATSYTWTGGSCAGTTGASCTVTPAATTTYTVSGVNSGGTSTPASATVTLTAPSSRLINLSTRGPVQTGDNVMIGGFVIGGSTPKKVLIKVAGPNLANYGVTGVLADPTLQLFSGQTPLASNNDWGSASNAAEIQATNLAPANAKESAILTTLNPGAYTAIVSGVNNGVGVGIIEVYDMDHPEAPLINISTRGKVQTGDGVMIGGFIIQGSGPQTVLIRAGGPTLANYGVTGALANPKLDLYAGQTVIASNDDWQAAANAAAIAATGLAPVSPLESAILITLQPGPYTAIVSGVNGGTGVAIVEVFAQ